MTNNLTNKVMDQVVRYEQRRARRWWWVFWALLAILGSGVALTIYSIVVELKEDETLSIFNIITEDKVALSQAWRDIVGVIWEDLTHAKIYALGVGVLLLLGAIILTRRRRRAMARTKRDMGQLGEKD